MSGPVLAAFEPLFATPLLRFTLAEAAALNPRLLAEAAAMRAASAGMRASNQHGWHSAMDFFHRAEPGCAALRGHIVEAARQATLRIAPAFDFTRVSVQAEGWININGPGAFNTPHDHPGWAWSGTYYVAVPPDPMGRSGMIEFLDGRTNLGVLGIAGATCLMPKFTWAPQPGEMLLFPAWLKHWVYPNEQAEERVSVAFNLRFVPRQPAARPDRGTDHGTAG